MMPVYCHNCGGRELRSSDKTYVFCPFCGDIQPAKLSLSSTQEQLIKLLMATRKVERIGDLPHALQRYRDVLEKDPKNEAARLGISRVKETIRRNRDAKTPYIQIQRTKNLTGMLASLRVLVDDRDQRKDIKNGQVVDVPLALGEYDLTVKSSIWESESIHFSLTKEKLTDTFICLVSGGRRSIHIYLEKI